MVEINQTKTPERHHIFNVTLPIVRSGISFKRTIIKGKCKLGAFESKICNGYIYVLILKW